MSDMLNHESNIVSLNSKDFWENYCSDINAVLLDVRTREEFEEIRIPNSILIDFYQPNFLEEISKLDINKSYYIYCKKGIRSLKAAKNMYDFGITKIYNLAEGITTWDGPTE
ncbi:MAG: rhodanese-like domain-containing protein [bacterium]